MRIVVTATLVAAALVAGTALAATPHGYKGRKCTPPAGHRIADCRVARHGTPDLSRAAWKAIFNREVTISARIRSLASNPAANNARSWPLIDSLAQPMGRLQVRPSGALEVLGLDGTPFLATVVNVRGHGCAASTAQMKRFPIVQIIAPKAINGGVQGFVDGAALDVSTDDGAAAKRAFDRQRGGGTGCGPSGKETHQPTYLNDPDVGATAHARLSNGVINSVDEYDAKPQFGNVVYFSANTTSVKVGGVARGMVRVGTLIARVDSFSGCDPNSDGTLTWRYWSIHTLKRSHPRLYGWIPARCG